MKNHLITPLVGVSDARFRSGITLFLAGKRNRNRNHGFKPWNRNRNLVFTLSFATLLLLFSLEVYVFTTP